ncbi:MAG: ABC transporter ATP-binding protein [Candidatus Limivicinus sp.]|nr:ABC transporter ATP-binding protein [Candidatus Limivicinus sp.]
MNAIEIRQLRKSYPGFDLGPLDLSLPQGCIMGLIGENGAGKTTTIRLILDMLQRDGGSIRLLGRGDGEDVMLTREETGVVLDEVGFPECFNASQVNNVMRLTYKNWDQAAYREYLRRFDLPEGKQFKDFSRGMKMKLGIAVALSHKPKLLILDEPTSGLDPVVRDEVVELFSEFTRDPSHSILISSHIVSDLEKLCDYIAFLHKGKLLLCEEKDLLLSEYCILRCTVAELNALPKETVKGRKENPYGVTAIVRRDAAPAGASTSPISIEELFVFMVKEA